MFFGDKSATLISCMAFVCWPTWCAVSLIRSTWPRIFRAPKGSTAGINWSFPGNFPRMDTKKDGHLEKPVTPEKDGVFLGYPLLNFRRIKCLVGGVLSVSELALNE